MVALIPLFGAVASLAGGKETALATGLWGTLAESAKVLAEEFWITEPGCRRQHKRHHRPSTFLARKCTNNSEPPKTSTKRAQMLSELARV